MKMPYYIHGFNSSANSSTTKLFNAKGLNWNSAAPFEENLEILKYQITEPDVLIGSSLGGFYAAMIGYPAILVNPCTWPTKLLKPGTYTNYDTAETFTLTQDIIDSYKNTNFPAGVPRLVIIGTEDKIIDPVENTKFWETRAKVITYPFGHRINNLEPFLKEIEEFKNIAVI